MFVSFLFLRNWRDLREARKERNNPTRISQISRMKSRCNNKFSCDSLYIFCEIGGICVRL